jgi:hypothetical protein
MGREGLPVPAGVTLVFVYAYVARASDGDARRYIGLALTERGKWIAGAVSARDLGTVLGRAAEMAREKAAKLVGGESRIVITSSSDERVAAAEAEAFRRLP